jgi:uncharacterized DUF497 family protein
MEYIKFEWDPQKNILNLKQHGINFEEAKYLSKNNFPV